MSGYRGKQDLENLWKIVSATGGSITTSGNYTIHTFNSNGTFTITSAQPVVNNLNTSAKNISQANAVVEIDFLLVAGGGAGGANNTSVGGGGGAGGTVFEGIGTRIPIASYPIVIGTGGSSRAVNSAGCGDKGTKSKFYKWTALGGQGGIGAVTTTNANNSTGGGPGGGSSSAVSYAGDIIDSDNDTTVTVRGMEPRNGGASVGGSCGGGAGAGGDGGPGVSTERGGLGGIGVTSSITGTSLYYGDGGGGGSDAADTEATTAIGGSGNGGTGSRDGASGNATAGVANTGSGGGGCGEDNTSTGSGSGGTGVFIIRYRTT